MFNIEFSSVTVLLLFLPPTFRARSKPTKRKSFSLKHDAASKELARTNDRKKLMSIQFHALLK
jgi:hypothetical protein